MNKRTCAPCRQRSVVWIRTTVAGISVLAFSASQISTASAQTAPCYVLGNVDNNTSLSTQTTIAGLASLSAAETSTTRAFELLGNQREKRNKSCPLGFANVDGLCEPATQVATAAPANPSNAQASASSGSATTGSSSQQNPSARQSASANTPSISQTQQNRPAPTSQGGSSGSAVAQNDQGRTYHLSLEGFYDFEVRNDIPSEAGAVDRDQKSYGALVSTERVAVSGNRRSVLGIMGGGSTTKQNIDAGAGTSTSRPSYQFDLESGVGPVLQSVNYALPFEISGDIKQRLDATTVGLYGSYSKNNFFFDGLFSVDFGRIRRESATAPSDVTINLSSTNGENPEEAGVPLTIVTASGQVFNSVGGGNYQLADGSGAVVPVGTIHPGGCISTGAGAAAIVGAGNAQLSQSQQDQLFNLAVDNNNVTIAGGTGTAENTTNYQNYIVGSNIGYRYESSAGYFFEPALGFRFTFSDFRADASTLGLEDGHILRLQGGLKFGRSKLFQSVSTPTLWTGSLSAVLYSDVLIDGYVRNATGSSPLGILDDEGKLRMSLSLRNEFDFLNGSVLFLEASGRAGEDYYGVNGRVGGKIRF